MGQMRSMHDDMRMREIT